MDSVEGVPVEVEGHGRSEAIACEAGHQRLDDEEGMGRADERLIRPTHQVLDEDVVVLDEIHGRLPDGVIMATSGASHYPYRRTWLEVQVLLPLRA
jgi:hypothetical protein